MATSIGTLHETALHAQLKQWHYRPGDEVEVVVDGYHIDLRRGDLLIEVQTRNFAQLKAKLSDLLQRHRVRVVHPIAQDRWIVRTAAKGRRQLGRRKSPKHGRIENVFDELVSLPDIITHPQFSLEVLLTREEEVRLNDGRGSWRRKGWSILDRRLLEVVASHIFASAEDFAFLLPDGLPRPFTVSELSESAALPRPVAGRMVYCLRHMSVLELVGKRGNAFLYARC